MLEAICASRIPLGVLLIAAAGRVLHRARCSSELLLRMDARVRGELCRALLVDGGSDGTPASGPRCSRAT